MVKNMKCAMEFEWSEEVRRGWRLIFQIVSLKSFLPKMEFKVAPNSSPPYNCSVILPHSLIPHYKHLKYEKLCLLTCS